jgi:hypothetical protein
VVVVFVTGGVASGAGSGLQRSRRLTSVVHELATANRTTNEINASHLSPTMEASAYQNIVR